MSSKFSQQNNIFSLHDARSLVVHDQLPAAVYVIKFHPERGFYLEMTESFSLPKKMYGTVEKDATRVLRTFADRAGSTGILLTGERGSGKTMLAKAVARQAEATAAMPTLLVNQPFNGDGFNTFIQNITQDAIVMFDEFEKVYDAEDQEKILTLLDGTVRTKKLFIFTSNDKYKVNQHMQNRPGRIFYLKEYKGIDQNFIAEYCRDNLKPNLQRYVATICQYTTLFYSFNFDMLQAIVEEMNRFDESPQDAITLLNAKPGFGAAEVDYLANVYHGSNHILKNIDWSGSPLTNAGTSFSWYYWHDINGNMADDQAKLIPENISKEALVLRKINRNVMNFKMNDMKSISQDGVITFQNKEGFLLTLTKAPEKVYNPMHYMAM